MAIKGAAIRVVKLCVCVVCLVHQGPSQPVTAVAATLKKKWVQPTVDVAQNFFYLPLTKEVNRDRQQVVFVFKHTTRSSEDKLCCISTYCIRCFHV